MNKLEYIANKLAFNKVSADEIQAVVDGLLNEGTYSDDFLEIINSTPACLAEVLPPFLKYLKSLGIYIPSKDEAVWNLIAHHIRKIADKEVPPTDGLTKLIEDVYWDYDFHSSARQYLGDSHGIHCLIGLFWEYDDICDCANEKYYGKPVTEMIEELKLAVIEEARRWRDIHH
jgi:hypothetical protein